MRAKSEKGFTLIEYLVSMLLTSIIMGAVYSVFRVQTHSTKVQENRLEAQEYSRAVLDMMVREIRNAGYAPTGAACAGVDTANAQTLKFQYDANANGTCTLAGIDNNESIEYKFDTTGCPAGFGNIMRKATVPVTDEAMTDCNIPIGAANFSFLYYPQQTTGAAPPPYCYPGTTNPSGCVGDLDIAANRDNIQRVTISITVRSKDPDAEFGGQLDATMTSSVDLRNRGLPS